MLGATANFGAICDKYEKIKNRVIGNATLIFK